MYTLTIRYTDGTHITDKLTRINEGRSSDEWKLRKALSDHAHEVREAEYSDDIESVILFDTANEYIISEWHKENEG